MSTSTWLTRDELKDRIRPKNFDPAEVEVVGFMDTRPPQLNAGALFGLPADMYELVVAEFKAERDAWLARNVELFGRDYPGSSCEHCGASIRWAGIVRYLPTGQHFIVGETCADERMELTNRGQHDSRIARMNADATKQRLARLEARATFYREHPAEAAYLYDESRPYNGFMSDLARKLEQYGELSEKQLACVTREVERESKREERIAADAIALADAPPLAEGRYQYEGTVVYTAVRDGGYGPVLKMIVKLDDGNKIWSTVPDSLYTGDVLVGQRVRLTATVERSQDDEHFGFAKRPAKAVVVTSEEATA